MAAGGKDDRRWGESLASSRALQAYIQPAFLRDTSRSKSFDHEGHYGTRRKNLLIRDHPLYFAEIAGAYQGAFAQLAFTFFVFRGQDVAQVRMSALHFPGPGFLEALGRAFVRFQFRHKSSKSAVSFSAVSSEYST